MNNYKKRKKKNNCNSKSNKKMENNNNNHYNSQVKFLKIEQGGRKTMISKKNIDKASIPEERRK